MKLTFFFFFFFFFLIKIIIRLFGFCGTKPSFTPYKTMIHIKINVKSHPSQNKPRLKKMTYV